ncbi:hypothetical protein BpHYR1_041684 [Brachionus plicatilis]|uniref:Uncharacterized protein n=1 Tax=Brachionus plicatilis TaxID=10195 RepID=A0A3M7STD1_BRAPC|nr:hypothetical protein BpHYR1_041684 [Brachionus plicatilis]
MKYSYIFKISVFLPRAFVSVFINLLSNWPRLLRLDNFFFTINHLDVDACFLSKGIKFKIVL